MQHEFRFTLAMFPGKEFIIEAPSLIAAMMKAMSENGADLADNVLRELALQIIEDVNYKWLNKP